MLLDCAGHLMEIITKFRKIKDCLFFDTGLSLQNKKQIILEYLNLPIACSKRRTLNCSFVLAAIWIVMY